MTHPFETPGQMRTRMDKGAKTAIGGQMMSPDAPITKRISQPRIESSELAARIPEIRAWLQAWKDEEARTEGLTLATTKKSSAGLRFSVPSSITFASLEDYVAWIGSTQDYQVAGRRIGELTDLDARLFGMTRIWQGLAALSEPDFLSFLELLRWRRDNPDSHPPVRALAIPGLDTKWIEGHQMLVKAVAQVLAVWPRWRRSSPCAPATQRLPRLQAPGAPSSSRTRRASRCSSWALGTSPSSGRAVRRPQPSG